MQPNRIADLVVLVMILSAQWWLARHYFPEWKQRLSPAGQRILRAAIWLLWTLIALNTLFTLLYDNQKFNWVPTTVRSVIVAGGTIAGLGTLVSLVLWGVFSGLAKWTPKHSPARRQLLLTAGKASVVAPFAAAAYGGFIQRTNFQIKEVNLPIVGLHPDLEGIRIGQLSDLHVSPYLSVKELGRAVDMMNQMHPHLVAVTGDLITRIGDPLDEAIRELARLRADAGVFGCHGNHEVYSLAEHHVTRVGAQYGMDFLRMRARQLRFGAGVLNIGGVDFQSFSNKRLYLKGAETLIVPGATNILLSHNPDVFPAAARQGWDATMSGHTHGGQLTVEMMNQTLNVARLLTPYVAGLYRVGNSSGYVTAGIGTITMPVRLGAPPEITVLRLTRADGLSKPESSANGDAASRARG